MSPNAECCTAHQKYLSQQHRDSKRSANKIHSILSIEIMHTEHKNMHIHAQVHTLAHGSVSDKIEIPHFLNTTTFHL